MKVYLSAFADEAAESLDEQIAALREERIPFIELRGVDGRNVSELSLKEAEDCRKRLEGGSVKVWSIGSPIGKISLADDFEAHLQKAEHVFRLAEVFRTRRVRVFSFFTDDYERDREKVFDRMRAFAQLARKYGVILCHENEKGIYGDGAARCEELLKGTEGLRCVFDPANFVQCGEDVSNALALLRDRADYYHIKDALYGSGAVVPAGEGDGALNSVIGELNRDTVLTLEPHLAVFKGYAQIDGTQLRNKYAYPSARAAFSAAAEALRKLLKEHAFREEEGVWIR